MPDVDCIAGKFFHAKKGQLAPQFRNKKIVLHLHLKNEVYNACINAKQAAAEAVCVST
jgi:hypothetical protein